MAGNDLLTSQPQLGQQLFGGALSLPPMPQMQLPSTNIPGFEGLGMPGFNIGPLSGELAGQTQSNYQDVLSRNERASDLEYQNASLAAEQNQKMAAVQDAVSDVIKQQAGIQSGILKSGAVEQAAQTGLQADIATSQAQTSNARMVQLHNHSEGLYTIAETIKQTPDFLSNPEAQRYVANVARQAGIDDLPKIWSPSNMMQVIQAANALQNSLPFNQEMAKMKLGQRFEVGDQNYENGFGKLQVQQQTEMLKYQAQLAMNRELRIMSLPDDQRKLLVVQEKISSGQALDEIDLFNLRGIAARDPAVSAEETKIDKDMINMRYQNMDMAQLQNTAKTQFGMTDSQLKNYTNVGQLRAVLGQKEINVTREFILEKQVAKLTGGSTIMTQSGPMHYAEVGGQFNNFQLVKGPGITGNNVAPSSQNTVSQTLAPQTQGQSQGQGATQQQGASDAQIRTMIQTNAQKGIPPSRALGAALRAGLITQDQFNAYTAGPQQAK